MGHWAGKKIESNTLIDYQKEWNSDSLDGLPGLRACRRLRGDRLVLGDLKLWFSQHRCQTEMLLSALFASFMTLLGMQLAGLTTITMW